MAIPGWTLKIDAGRVDADRHLSRRTIVLVEAKAAGKLDKLATRVRNAQMVAKKTILLCTVSSL
jgi:hypothetical protein